MKTLAAYSLQASSKIPGSHGKIINDSFVCLTKQNLPVHNKDKLFLAWNSKDFHFMNERDMEYTLPDTDSQSK